jgi:hypothetical protein
LFWGCCGLPSLFSLFFVNLLSIYSRDDIELALEGVEKFLWVLAVFTGHAKKWIRIGLLLSTIDFALVKKYVETFIDPDPRRPADGIGFGLTMGAKTVEVIAMAAVFFYQPPSRFNGHLSGAI